MLALPMLKFDVYATYANATDAYASKFISLTLPMLNAIASTQYRC